MTNKNRTLYNLLMIVKTRKMESIMSTCLFRLLLVLFDLNFTRGCVTGGGNPLTMVEILYQSDIVVYGRDIQHAKLRNPTDLDCRFKVHCVLKSTRFEVPDEIIIEKINEVNECTSKTSEIEVGKEYIFGLDRQMSGFLRFSDVDKFQAPIYPPTWEILEKLHSICELNKWILPVDGDNSTQCPVVNGPNECVSMIPPKAEPDFIDWIAGLFGGSNGAPARRSFIALVINIMAALLSVSINCY